MRTKLAALIAGTLTLATQAVLCSQVPAGAAQAATGGVTATTIAVGIPYVDLADVRQFGITLDQGNYADAYNAVIANINAHGGVDGRKLVPYIVAVNPVGTAAAETACTQLTEDDKVFVAISPQQPDCFLQRGVATISGNFQNITTGGGAPNFTLTPPGTAYDPVQLAAFAHEGVFRGKKVGLFAGQTTDQTELHVVAAALHMLHVPVAVSVVDDAADRRPGGDLPAGRHHRPALPVRRGQRGGRGGHRLARVARGAGRQPELVPPTLPGHEPGHPHCRRTGELHRAAVPQERAGREPGAFQLPDLAHALCAALRERCAQGLPRRQDDAAHQPHQGLRPDVLFGRGCLHQPGTVHDHRQGGRAAPHADQLGEGGLPAPPRDHPRRGRTGLPRGRAGLPAGPRHPGHLRPGHERLGLRQPPAGRLPRAVPTFSRSRRTSCGPTPGCFGSTVAATERT